MIYVLITLDVVATLGIVGLVVWEAIRVAKEWD